MATKSAQSTEPAQSVLGAYDSEKVGQLASAAGLCLLMFSVYFGFGALLHAALLGWVIDWTSLLGVILLIAWPALPVSLAVGLSCLMNALGWLAGKLRTRR